MGRYNEILRQVEDDDLQPCSGLVATAPLIAADWAEGFLQAIMLRADAWEWLLKSKRDGQLLVPILALCGDENGESLLGIPPDEGHGRGDRVYPACVAAIAAYWREKRPKQVSMPFTAREPSQFGQALSKSRPQRPMSLLLRQKVQKMLRQNRLSPQHVHCGLHFTGCVPK